MIFIFIEPSSLIIITITITTIIITTTITNITTISVMKHIIFLLSPLILDWGDNQCSHLEDVAVRCSGPDVNKRCEKSCSDGYFPSNGMCLECPLDCKTCSSPDSCKSCIKKRFLEGREFKTIFYDYTFIIITHMEKSL